MIEKYDDRLTDKQEMFISCYLGGASFNATDAAKMAGYSERTATEQGYQLRKDPRIRARIDAILAAESMTRVETLHELTAVARAPITAFQQILQAEYTDKDGRVHPQIVRQDLSAKVKALELLAKAHSMLSNVEPQVQVQQTTIIGVPLEDVTGKPVGK